MVILVLGDVVTRAHAPVSVLNVPEELWLRRIVMK